MYVMNKLYKSVDFCFKISRGYIKKIKLSITVKRFRIAQLASLVYFIFEIHNFSITK